MLAAGRLGLEVGGQHLRLRLIGEVYGVDHEEEPEAGGGLSLAVAGRY